MEPGTSSVPQLPQRHTGMGVPQKRLRETDQSRASAIQFLKRPVPMWAGTQLMSSLHSSSLSRFSATFTYQLEMAR